MKAVKQSGTCSTFWFLGLFSFPGFDCFSFNQGMEKNNRQIFHFLENCRIPPFTINCNTPSVFLFQDKCWIRKSTDSSTKDRMLAATWTSQDIFGEKSWNGEWKKDHLRARLTIEKLCASTFGSEIPSQVSKLGKKCTFFFSCVMSIICKTSEIN